jgi:hypothetical protein
MRSSLYLAVALYITASLALPQLWFASEIAEAIIEADDAPLSVPESLVGDDLFVDTDIPSMMKDLQWKTVVVNAHNDARRHHGAGNVVWNDALYPGTLQWAKQCKFKHRWVSVLRFNFGSDFEPESDGHYGENLAAGTGSSYGFLNGFQDWMNEGSECHIILVILLALINLN